MRGPFLAGLLIIATGTDRGTDDPNQKKSLLSQAIELRRARLSRIESISCSFRRETSVSPEVIASYAKDNGVPVERAKKTLLSKGVWRYDETSRGLFLLRCTAPGSDGRMTSKLLLSHDGRQSWRFITEPIERGLEASRVEVGGDIALTFSSLAIAREMLDGILPQRDSLSLVGRVIEAENAREVGVEQIEGNPCVLVMTESIVGGDAARYSIWLDTARQFVPRRGRIEAIDPENKQWCTHQLWTVQKLEERNVRGIDDSEHAYWFPTQTTLQSYNGKGREECRNKVTVETLEFNTAMHRAWFTPEIPPGTVIRDARDTVFRRKRSNLQTNKVEAQFSGQGRNDPRDSDDPGEPGQQNPPSLRATDGSLPRYLFGGAAMAIAILILLTRKHRSPSA
jgi:hypothetical protein